MDKHDSNEYMNMDFGSNARFEHPKTISNKVSTIPNYLPLKATTNSSSVFSPNKNLIRPRCDSKDSGIFPFSPGSPERTLISSMQRVNELDEREDDR
jgi:hypothetical protein